jgi:hypothetical protein
MKITDKLHQEHIELNEEWLKKKRIGLIKYIFFGWIRCFLFISAIMLIHSIIERQFSFLDFAIAAFAGLIIPIMSWYLNELRLKLMSGK